MACEDTEALIARQQRVISWLTDPDARQVLSCLREQQATIDALRVELAHDHECWDETNKVVALQQDEIDSLKAQLMQTTVERDLNNENASLFNDKWGETLERAEAAEAREATLREKLDELVSGIR